MVAVVVVVGGGGGGGGGERGGVVLRAEKGKVWNPSPASKIISHPHAPSSIFPRPESVKKDRLKHAK